MSQTLGLRASSALGALPQTYLTTTPRSARLVVVSAAALLATAALLGIRVADARSWCSTETVKAEQPDAALTIGPLVTPLHVTVPTTSPEPSPPAKIVPEGEPLPSQPPAPWRPVLDPVIQTGETPPHD